MARHESEARTQRSADEATSLLAASQAVDWQDRLRKPSRAVQEEYLAWLQESPVHVREMLLLITMENDVRSLRSSQRRSLRQPVDFSSLRSAWHRPLCLFKQVVGYAAVAMLAMIVTHYSLQPPRPEPIPAERQSMVVPLADGSSVIAGPDSRIRIEFGAHARNVVLEAGEAAFHVAADDGRPFNVLADQLLVETDGGKFEIRRRGKWASVIVMEGNVLAGSVGLDAESSYADALLSKKLVKGQSLSISDLQQVRERRWIRAALVMDPPH